MPFTQNKFFGGMNKDLSKTDIQQTVYDNGLNIRLVTDTGTSTKAVANIRGNEFILQIPNTGNFVNIIFNSIPTIPTIYTISINGLTDTFNYSGISNIYDEFAIFLNLSTIFSTLNISSFSYGTSLGLYSTSHLTLSITITGTTITNIVPPLTNLVPISSTNIRDEIIIFTCTDINPSGSSPSQIWRLTYDKEVLQNSPTGSVVFTLLYNNKLNFSQSFPIAPGAIVGNFENINTKKTYWCDFNNPIRNFNTADPNAYFLDPGVINNNPKQSPSVPILQKVNGSGGSLPSGVYGYTYRLSNSAGTSTRFYPLSNPLHIVLAQEDSTDQTFYPHNTYDGSLNTGKSVTILISNIDTNFDNIEIAYVRRKSYTNIPDTIAIIGSIIPINKITGQLLFTHFGNEPEEVITIDELINPIITPDIAKTLATKDNLLLIGNVKVKKLDLDFDARAFRYPVSSNTTYPTNTLPDVGDDINPNQEPRDYNNYLYQKNSTKLGGTGTNISYEFVTTQTYLDELLLTTLPPYKFTLRDSTTINLGINGQDYPQPNFYRNPISPYVESVLRGYQRDETYRFFFTAFDLKGNPAWSKWIADIRMPSIYMPNTSSTISTDRSLQYPLVSLLPVATTVANNLGIKFTVDTSLLTNQISGYSITRVKREQKDKTILAQGILKPVFEESRSSAINFFALFTQDSLVVNSLTATAHYNKQYLGIISPETYFKNFGSISSIPGTDKVEFIDHLFDITASAQQLYKIAGIALSNTRAVKAYSSIPKTINNTYKALGDVPNAGVVGRKFTVDSSLYIDSWFNHPSPYLFSGNNIFNINRGSQYGSSSGVATQGGQLFGVKVSADTEDYSHFASDSSANHYINTDSFAGNASRYLVNYRRELANQYGGNTLVSRSSNETILCNHYQPITSGTTIYSSNVYGGDTFIDIFDQFNTRKAWLTANSQPAPDPGAGPLAVADFFPCESCININMRSKGTSISDYTTDTTGHPTINSQILPDNGTFIDIIEDGNNNPVFSNENDIMKFLPKPIPFTEQDTFDHRVYASDTKIDGEITDSWRNFKPSNYRDVDSLYGPINNIATLGANLYFWQDRGFGSIPVNRRVLIPDGTATELQLGTGLILEKHEYISNKIGSKHQWSIIGTDKAFYWYDILSNKQIRYNQNGVEQLSDIHGMHSWLENNIKKDIINNDNPILGKGVIGVYDYKYNEAISTFLDGTQGIQSTLSFSEQTQSYTSFYSYIPRLYITDKYIIISPNPITSNKLYVHDYGQYGRFYDNYYNSSIKFLTNEHPEINKTFNNLILQTEVLINNVDTASGLTPIQETINQIQYSNDYQTTSLLNLTSGVDIKRKFRTWRTQIGRANIQSEIVDVSLFGRMRDKYMYTEAIFLNNNNKRFILHDSIIGYTLSPY